MKSNKFNIRKALLIVVSSLVVVALCVGLLFFALKDDSSSQEKEDPNIIVSSPEEVAAQLKELGDDFGYENALSELTEKSTTSIDGDTYYRLQQNYQGIPVYGRTVVYVTDENGKAIAITGNALDVGDNIQLEPSISYEQIKESVYSYFENTLGYTEITTMDIPFPDEDYLCIYNSEVDGVLCLAYNIDIVFINATEVGVLETIIDANSAEILFVNSKLKYDTEVTLNLQGQEQLYEDVRCTVEDGTYKLNDLQFGIGTCLAINKMTLFDLLTEFKAQHFDGAEAVVWNQNSSPDAAAVDAYANTQISYQFFDKVLGNKSTDGKGEAVIAVLSGLIQKDGEDWTNNAYSSSSHSDDSKVTVLGFGIGEDNGVALSAYLDTVAHEYMHGVETFHSNMTYSGESGAIMEALSDIFGELVESWNKENNGLTQTSPDWIHNIGRNLYNPEKSGNPWAYKGKNWYSGSQDNGGVHINSTVISHAAYLMSEDGGGLLTMDELAKLWYRTMLMMPSGCDFAQCRTLVELAGESMDLSDKQMQCISSAFDNAGILDSDTVDYTIDSDVELNVYSVDSQLCDDYTIYVSGRQLRIENIDKLDKDALGIPLDFKYLSMMLTKEYFNVIEVKTAQTTNVYLPFGVYTITLCDNADNSKTYSFRVSVEGSGNKNKLDIYTDFSNDDVSVDKQLTKIVRYDQYNDALGYSYELSYNDKNQLVGLVHGQASSETKHDPTFTYSPDGKLLWIITGEPTDAYAPSQNSGYGYEYDSSGHLIKEFVWEGGYAETTHYYDSSGYRIRSVSYGDAYVQTENHVYDPDGVLLYSEVDVVYSDESAEHYVVEYDYSYKPFVLKRQNNAGWTQISLCVENNISVLDFFMQDVQLYVDAEGYLEKAVTESETYCFYYTEDDDTSSPNTDVELNAPDEEESAEGFVGNQTAEQLRKSIVGSWGRIGSITSNYDFNSDGSCYGWIDKQEAGVYEISDNKTLTITFPWIKHQYSWTQESFDEWRSHSSEDFWYMTDSGELRLNGISYYCYRDGKVNINYSTEGELLTKIAGAWVLDDNNEYRFFIDGTYEENKVLFRYGLLLSRENFEAGPVEIIDDTHAKLWNDVESFGEIPSYTELEYDPETDTLCIGGSNNIYHRAEYSD